MSKTARKSQILAFLLWGGGSFLVAQGNPNLPPPPPPAPPPTHKPYKCNIPKRAFANPAAAAAAAAALAAAIARIQDPILAAALQDALDNGRMHLVAPISENSNGLWPSQYARTNPNWVPKGNDLVNHGNIYKGCTVINHIDINGGHFNGKTGAYMPPICKNGYGMDPPLDTQIKGAQLTSVLVHEGSHLGQDIPDLPEHGHERQAAVHLEESVTYAKQLQNLLDALSDMGVDVMDPRVEGFIKAILDNDNRHLGQYLVEKILQFFNK